MKLPSGLQLAACTRRLSQIVAGCTSVSTAAGVCVLVVAALGVSSPSTAGAAGTLRVTARPSPGCALKTVNGGEATLSFVADGDNGSYDLQVPTTATTGTPLPAIFDFHGYEEPGQLHVQLSGLGTYGQTHGFVTVTPWINGRQRPYWLSFAGSKDLQWFGGLLHHVEATTCVDENRVYVTGYSNGAFMSSHVACQYSSEVAAVAPVSGIQAVSPCKTRRPVPVVAFHGRADPLIHYDGSASRQAQNLPGPDGGTLGQSAKMFGVIGIFRKGPSIPQQAGTWARRNGCSGNVTTTRVAADVTLLAWSCPHHANVELFAVQGGGHTWPGSRDSAMIGKLLGRTTFSISADVEMWNFFQSHPLTRSD